MSRPIGMATPTVEELEAEVERLRKQQTTWREHTESTWKGLLDKAEQEIERLCDIIETQEDAIKTFYAEIERLRVALERYGHHLCTCSSMDKMDSGTLFHRSDWPCDCGFKEAHREALNSEG